MWSWVVSFADGAAGRADRSKSTLHPSLLSIQVYSASKSILHEGQVSATLNCTGLWQTLDWQYYADSSGRVVFDESDNVEHLLPGAIQVIPLLESCPSLQILATSRAPLRILPPIVVHAEGKTFMPKIEAVLREGAGLTL